MLSIERQKVYYESEIITDVKCDLCGKTLTSDDDNINVVNCYNAYFEKGKQHLEVFEYGGYIKHLCDECMKPVNKIFGEITT